MADSLALLTYIAAYICTYIIQLNFAQGNITMDETTFLVSRHPDDEIYYFQVMNKLSSP